MINIINMCILFVYIWFSLINVSRLIKGQGVPIMNFVIQALALTLVLYLDGCI